MKHHHFLHRRFRLLRWFSVLSFVCIAIGAIATATVLSRFLTENLLIHEAEVMTEFVNSTLNVNEAKRYFLEQQPNGTDDNVSAFFSHLGNMPSLLRANLFLPDRSIVWSSDSKLIGRAFQTNEELDRAFTGKPAINIGVVDERAKEEHIFFESIGQRFIESYLPIFDQSQENTSVIAVFEVYRSPQQLFRMLHDGNRLIWISSAAAGVLLYVVLFWVVRRADQIMRRQERQLVETETLVAVGDMASVVAHSLRNPLSSIRSSAELALAHEPDPKVAGPLEEVINQADRIGTWIRRRVEAETGDDLPGDAATAVGESLQSFAGDLTHRGIRLSFESAAGLPAVNMSSEIISQIVNGLIANAIEAMSEGGELEIKIDPAPSKYVMITITDTGPGMSHQAIEDAFKPFTSSKLGSSGMGLPLAKRLASRYGGDLSLTSSEGKGVTASLAVPVAKQKAWDTVF